MDYLFFCKRQLVSGYQYIHLAILSTDLLLPIEIFFMMAQKNFQTELSPFIIIYLCRQINGRKIRHMQLRTPIRP
jgi:hypothetical protein